MIYLVTRHPGALEWLRQQVSEPVVHLEHLHTVETIKRGDRVAGNLPIHLVEQICSRGARYFHLQLELPPELRGRELTAEQLNRLNARLVEYIVFHPCEDEAVLQYAREREVC